jgi:hypothetical protein
MLVGLPFILLDTVQNYSLIVRGLWVAVIGGLLFKKYTLTAIVLVALGLIVHFDVFSSYVYSPYGILSEYAALQANDPRFDRNTEVDLQIGDGTLVRDPARWLDRGKPRGPLLLFPPSLDQLSMIGANGH